MLFNSFEFAIFLPLVFFIYWQLKGKRLQNFFLVVSSYFFYGCWDVRFLALIFASTILDFSLAKRIGRTNDNRIRKNFLWASIVFNIGILAYFKYFNFFLDNFKAIFTLFGAELNGESLNIILPVGISFYTFQTLSYTIDVYRRKIKPANDFVEFSAFVSFFPQLVAGPIERATNLLPQFTRKRIFNYSYAVDGLRQILWGLFKKMAIADNCAVIANQVFNNSEDMSGSALLIGAIFFAFQIYGDFSGYSDIAIGTARLLGFNLMKNFAFPYFSRDIAEFWRRWHISLSTWFRDYLYIPLGGSRGGIKMIIRNTIIIFLVSGFWHGANWTFVAWGLLNAIFFLPLIILGENRKNIQVVGAGQTLPGFTDLRKIILTFLMVVLSWVFFRSESLGQSIEIFETIFSGSLFEIPILGLSKLYTIQIVVLLLFFLVIEWIGRESEYAMEKLAFSYSRFIRWGFYMILVLLIFIFLTTEKEFIYFQF